MGKQRRVVELFAGVGGFRLGLERAGWEVVWSNQWEPTTKRQHASEAYVANFGADGHVCEDIAKVLDEAEQGTCDIPDHELLVGGFPCQDYSVAKALSQAVGIEGKKGVLWWEIHRLLKLKRPRYVLLENVDRLLKSPATQRGRDFAIILSCMSKLGYIVEWRVVNAADYGFPHRRRRVFLVGRIPSSKEVLDPLGYLLDDGVLAKALPVRLRRQDPTARPGRRIQADIRISSSLLAVSEEFGLGGRRSPFLNAGVMHRGRVWTEELDADYKGPRLNLNDVLLDDAEVDESFFVSDDQLPRWQYLKDSKREERCHAGSGTTYFYTEGALPFPDPLDRPSRTVLTGEGGRTPSRFKHIIRTADGRFRRLTPVELERLNGFDDDWTATGMPDSRRAFCMGNALVVGVVERIGAALAEAISRDDRARKTSQRIKESAPADLAGEAVA